MNFTIWMLVIGALLVIMAMSSSILKRLPVSSSMLYLAAGFVLGPAGIELLPLETARHANLVERGAEVAVLISLFASGLKLRLSPSSPYWRLSVRLAFGAMALTAGLVAATASYILALPLGAAVLLGAILSPTDPVLASDVQIQQPGDRDRVRFCLTSEAGLNDGSAFPLVMLGLGLLGRHTLGDFGLRWLAVDVLWGLCGGLALGGGIGWLIGRLILHLRIKHREALGLDEFLTLGLIALAYGTALLLHAYGFLAVFAAGFALQRVIVRATNANKPLVDAPIDEPAIHPAKAPEHMAREVLGFNEQLERIGEVGIMLFVGALLSLVEWSWQKIAVVLLLFFVIRPLSVGIGLLGTGATLTARQRLLIAWFGIRGIGSIYYLYFALKFHLDNVMGKTLFDLTLIAVTLSVILHGISVTPLMSRYGRTREARG